MAKSKFQRRIDAELPINAGFAVVETINDPAPPAMPTVPVPTGLALTTALARSAVTPTALIAASWNIPGSVMPQRYAVQWSVSSAFPDGSTGGFDALLENCTIDGLKCNTLYYVRVASVYSVVQSAWSDAVAITTDDDTIPPGPVTSAAGDYTTGDLILTWVNPTSANLKDVRVRIYASNGGTLLREVYSTNGRYTWTAANNYLDTAGSPDPAVYVILAARSYNNVVSTDVTLTVTKAAPVLTGSVTTNWDSDAGTSPADLVLSWTAVGNLQDYIITLDGVAHTTTDNRFSYSLSTNRQEHSGTPNYTITYSVIARDRLLQSSSALTGTITNAAPLNTNVAVAGTGFFSTLNVAITHTTPIQDLDSYAVKLYKNSSLLTTFSTKTASPVVSLSGAGTYKVGVIATDLFGRSSTEVLTSDTYMDSLTITELRSEGDYSDSTGTSFATTNINVLRDDVTTAATGIQYATSASAYRWTQFVRYSDKLIRRISCSIDVGATTFYIATSKDGTTWRWFAGITLVAGIPTLTERADQTTAAANVSAISTVTLPYMELPAEIEARYVVLYHRHTSVSYYVTEFYPRSWIQADDIRAGTLTAIHILAGSITADRLSVSQLSAITADLGTITAGTITGATIQTATSGARTVMSSASFGGLIGYGSSDTYDVSTGAGTYQVLWSKADGKLYWGGGGNYLDKDNGISIAVLTQTSLPSVSKYGLRWLSGATVVGALSTYNHSSAGGQVYLNSASGPTGGSVFINGTSFNTSVGVNIPSGGLTLGSGNVTIAGSLSASSSLRVGTNLYLGASQTANYLHHDGTYTRHQGALVIDGDIYWGTYGNWLSDYLNQAVLTTSLVAFNTVTLSNALMLTNNVGGSRRAYLRFGSFGTASWEISPDLNNNGTNDLYFYDASAGQTRLQIGPAGNVSIPQKVYIGALGVTPAYSLEIATNSVGKPGTNTWTISSDARLKNVLGGYTDGLEKLQQLRPIRYRYNGKANTPTDQEYVGLIAQEVLEVAPEMISSVPGEIDGETTDILQFDNHNMTYMLLNAVVELAARVTMLEGRHD